MNILVLITFVTFVGSAVRVLSGLGGGTIIVTTLIHFLPLDQTIVLAAIIHWFNALLIVWFFWTGLRKRLVVLFALPGIVTSFIGSQVLAQADSSWLLPYLGVFLLSYVLFVWLDPKFKLRQDPLTLSIGGGISGFSKSIFGVGGGVNAAVLSAFDLPKASYLATGGAISLALDSARLFGYWWHGMELPLSLRWGLLFFIPAALLGSLLGRFLVNWIPQKYFRKVILIFLLGMGLYLVVSNYV